MRKGDLVAIEVEYAKLHPAEVLGKKGSVEVWRQWLIVRASHCTTKARGGKLVEAQDPAGNRYKMCEKLRQVRRIRVIPAEMVDGDALFVASAGIGFLSVEACAAFALRFAVTAATPALTAPPEPAPPS